VVIRGGFLRGRDDRCKDVVSFSRSDGAALAFRAGEAEDRFLLLGTSPMKALLLVLLVCAACDRRGAPPGDWDVVRPDAAVAPVGDEGTPTAGPAAAAAAAGAGAAQTKLRVKDAEAVVPAAV
jgi:hypothetical protein